MIKMKTATRLTLFSALLMTATIFILYMILITNMNMTMTRRGIAYQYSYISAELFIMLITSAIISYMLSAVVIDKVLNPIRLMSARVKDIGNMDFSKPLIIDSEDDELREYVDAFNDMSQKLGGYIDRQKRFISDASHELVTPVTVINGHADLLLRRGSEQPDLLINGLNIIKSEALRMDGLIDSLLLMARSDSGRQHYVFERISISMLVAESIEEAGILEPDFHFHTELDEDAFARCDESAIRRVLRIMLSNAVKYSGDARAIDVSVRKSHGLVTVAVRDNGIGIAPEHLSRIFDRFYRVDDSRSKKTGSSGLGLAIAKELIAAHGGEIQVSSEAGNGSEFRFILTAK